MSIQFGNNSVRFRLDPDVKSIVVVIDGKAYPNDPREEQTVSGQGRWATVNYYDGGENLFWADMGFAFPAGMGGIIFTGGGPNARQVTAQDQNGEMTITWSRRDND